MIDAVQSQTEQVHLAYTEDPLNFTRLDICLVTMFNGMPKINKRRWQ